MKDKRLVHTAAYYQEKLSAYAIDTITYTTLPFGFGVKINRHGNPAVVEDLGTCFKLYISEKPGGDDLLDFGSNRRASHSIFFARICTSGNNLIITTTIHRTTKVVYLIIWILMLVFGVIMTSKGQPGSILPSVFCTVVIPFTTIFGRIRFKTFVIRFLNNL